MNRNYDSAIIINIWLLIANSQCDPRDFRAFVQFLVPCSTNE